MGRAGVVALILLVLSAAVARPDDPPTKVEPITEKSLIGEWEANIPNGTLKVSFSAKKEGQTAALVLNAGGNVAVGVHAYEIDRKKNEVQFPGAKGGGVVRPAKDGALTIAGPFTFGGTRFDIPETKLTRVKAADPKK